MLSHSDFPVRMVQWRGREIVLHLSHSRLHNNLIQSKLIHLAQPFLTHSTSQERDLCLGRIKFLHT